MKKILEVLNENKKAILKGALLVGGTLLGAVIANNTILSNDDDYEVEYIEVQPEDISTEATSAE